MEKRNVSMDEKFKQGARIKVIGAGGGGGNAVNHMIDQGVEGVDFAIANTDIQAVDESMAPERIRMGMKTTRGLGAGAKPEVGRKAAEESMEEIEAMLDGYEMVFITAGLGGGTGTGSAPVIAEVARTKGILTVAVVTLPFAFEGRSRMKKALEGKRELAERVDTIITIKNDRLIGHLDNKDIDTKRAFAEVNNVLLQAVSGITNLIKKPGEINLDFADVQTIMTIRGAALMGMGVGKGENRVREAVESAIKNPLLDHGIDGANGVLLNIAGSSNLGFKDFVLANEIVSSYVDEDAEIIVGTVLDENIPEDTVIVTVVATGFEEETDEYGAKHVRMSTGNSQIAAPQQGESVPAVNKVEPQGQPSYSQQSVQHNQQYAQQPVQQNQQYAQQPYQQQGQPQYAQQPYQQQGQAYAQQNQPYNQQSVQQNQPYAQQPYQQQGQSQYAQQPYQQQGQSQYVPTQKVEWQDPSTLTNVLESQQTSQEASQQVVGAEVDVAAIEAERQRKAEEEVGQIYKNLGLGIPNFMK